jgi:hypothetical protein
MSFMRILAALFFWVVLLSVGSRAAAPVDSKVLDDSPKVSVVSQVEEIKTTSLSSASLSQGSLLAVGRSLVPTTLSVKMRYRALFDGNKTQVFDVTVPVYYDERNLLLSAQDRVLLQQYGAELLAIAQATEELKKRAERLSRGLAELYARGRPASLLAPGYSPVPAYSSSQGAGSGMQVPLVNVQ